MATSSRAALATLLAGALLAGCASTGAPAPAAQSGEGGFQSTRPEAGFGDYALVVPKNLVWWPWKIIGGTAKGTVDGIGAGFEEDRMPVLGLVFLPVNAVVGLLTGFGTGVVSEPGAIGPYTNFGSTMGLPMQRPTPIWWLPR